MPNGSTRFTRRRIGIITTTAALTALGLHTFSENASASVTLGTLRVPDASMEDTDGEPAGVYVYVNGKWEYNVNTPPASVSVTLYLRDTAGGFHAIDTTDTTTVANADTGSFELGGDILGTDAYSAADFRAPGPGLDRTVRVELGVLVQVFDDAGVVLADGRATNMVRVKVTESELTALVGGEGVVAFQADDDDPTPTPPPR